MLKVENIDAYGFEAAIRGLRNPMNSWAKSDSGMEFHDDEHPYCFIGKNDMTLMQKLYKGGTEHRKFMRMINVTMDITAPLYWWKEFDTYKVGTVANSCSTMHKIHEKEFTIEDFSHEHLWGAWDIPVPESEVDTDCYIASPYDEILLPIDILEKTIEMLNTARKLYLETNYKKYWWQMIQLLPSSYNQKRTVQMNYEVCANILRQRRNHKLDEWHNLCDEILKLPYFKEICDAV